MDHIIMQDSLEAIGQRLKDMYGRDSKKMQQALPAELLKAELQKINIIPAYNSRYSVCHNLWKCYVTHKDDNSNYFSLLATYLYTHWLQPNLKVYAATVASTTPLNAIVCPICSEH